MTMNEDSRIFDFIYYQLERFPQPDMLAGKINGSYHPFSTEEVVAKINELSAGILRLGMNGHDMEVENQDKIAIISCCYRNIDTA